MLENLIQADRKAFLAINNAHDPIVDFVMYWATDKWIWIPFYVWIIYILIKTFGSRTMMLMLMIAVLITISDQTSVFIKDSVQRLRPCHDAYFNGMIHLVDNYCGGSYGFVSSHASNTMTFTFFITGILPVTQRWLKAEMFAFVLLVSYSRIYLGAHYPGDILGGWLLGSIIGGFGIFVFRKLKIKEKI